MAKIEIDSEKQTVLWKIEKEQAKNHVVGWRMLENNRIEGILPFDYYYVDTFLCFHYVCHSLQSVKQYFQKKDGDFKTLYFLCEEILKVLENSAEYLLEQSDFLLQPEGIFWSHYEKKLCLCYLPGKGGNLQKEYTILVEYLMEHTNHADSQAVQFIYKLYDFICSENFTVETILSYVRSYQENNKEKTVSDKISGEKAGSNAKKPQAAMSSAGEEKGYLLSREIKEAVCQREENGKYLLQQKKTVVGRNKDCSLYLPFATVSRHHAVFIQEGQKLFVMDTASKNGTFINAKKISAYVKTECQGDDVLTFADISYRVREI